MDPATEVNYKDAYGIEESDNYRNSPFCLYWRNRFWPHSQENNFHAVDLLHCTHSEKFLPDRAKIGGEELIFQ